MQGEVTAEARELFRASANRVYTSAHAPSGIGTLSEHMLHAILKGYLCPDTTCHEQKVGRYHADILQEGRIYEIQTRRLDRLRPKLDALLDKYEITVVYPIAVSKTLSWLDPADGTLTPPRKSPRHGSIYDSLYELYSVREYLLHPHFHFRAVLCEMQEFKLLTGYGPQRKRRAPRAERIPTALVGDCCLEKPSDYARLLPPALQSPFTLSDLSKAAGIPPAAAWRAVQVYLTLGLVGRAGKAGRANLYAVAEGAYAE